ncbi:MAG: hypothetical protein IT363_07135 [Methanoregulaceae archaeon]|nr:hypothetical protein [Methanoregulaceae archaeon]
MMKRLLTVSMIAGLGALAMAFAPIGKAFDDHYKVAKDSGLKKAACAVCHVSPKGGKLNPYGLDMQAEMKKAKSKKLTPAILKELENLDSDKDGKKNIDEIKADSNPGLK